MSKHLQQGAGIEREGSSVGLMIIGDEILSGKRQDKHFPSLLQKLKDRGISLDWVQYLGDDRQRLCHALRSSFDRGDWVISCGGIGATPDDHTRQAAAAALGLELVLHPEACQLIAERCADMAAEGRGSADMRVPENQQRLKMGEFPAGASIIPNPFNKIPGFSIRNHCFVPGFPVMAWPMVDWVLDHLWTGLHHRIAWAERSWIVYELPESLATPVMESVEQEFPGVKVFCLPSLGAGSERRHLELGVKAHPSRLDAAFEALRQGIEALEVQTQAESV
ncbi:MAG: competence/damage-inducible protein A, partial [Betaproteobacteria bacterium]|nr:competence/damage-inducible protein A [Betaproteobacteria bacterium]